MDQITDSRRREIEEEMSRFEEEILHTPMMAAPPPPVPSIPPGFIPHQLQCRPLPPPPPMPHFHPGFGPMRPPNFPMDFGHAQVMPQRPPVVAAPQAPKVYSAQPVRNTASRPSLPTKVSVATIPVHKTNLQQQQNVMQQQQLVSPSVTATFASGPAAIQPQQSSTSAVAATASGTPAVAATPGTATTTTTSGTSGKKQKKPKKVIRAAGQQVWEDSTLLSEWDPDDFRIFCGDLGNDVTDEHLTRAFSKYPSFVKAKVVRDKRSNKSKGYGFVSFQEPTGFVKAMREMNGKYVGSRPIKLRKSTWKDRNIDVVKKKIKEKQKLGLL